MNRYLTPLSGDDRRFLAGISAAYLGASFSLILSWPLLWPDEAIFADSARGILVNGHPSTALVSGMASGAYWQPPAWFYFLSLFIRVLGEDIFLLRILSMLIGLCVLWATAHLVRLLGQSPLTWRLSLLLLALNPNFITYVKLVRMDGLCVLLTILGLHAYLRFCASGKSLQLALGCGLFTLSMLTHPLGVIGPAAAGCHAIFLGRKKQTWGSLVWFFLPLLASMVLWWMSSGNHAEFLLQMGFQMERKSRPLFVSFVAFLERYRSLPLFALLALAGLVNVSVRAFRERSPSSVLLAIGACISTIAIGLFFEIPYHVYCLPFIAIAAGAFLERYWIRVRPIPHAARIALVGVLCNFGAYILYFNYVFHIALTDETNYASFARQVEQEIPPGATVCLGGYPSLYWGLKASGREYTLVSNTFLSDSLAMDLVRKADWFVLTDGFDPGDDNPDVVMETKTMQRHAEHAGKICRLVRFVGGRKKFAYTARIFRFEPFSRASEPNNAQ